MFVSSPQRAGNLGRAVFPKSLQASVALPEPTARQIPKHGSELILVVEDDALVRRHLCALLKGLGYRGSKPTLGHCHGTAQTNRKRRTRLAGGTRTHTNKPLITSL